MQIFDAPSHTASSLICASCHASSLWGSFNIILGHFFIPTAQSILDKGNLSFHLRVITSTKNSTNKERLNKTFEQIPELEDGKIMEDLQEALNSFIRLRPMFYFFCSCSVLMRWKGNPRQPASCRQVGHPGIRGGRRAGGWICVWTSAGCCECATR